MQSSRTRPRVVLVRIDVSEEFMASTIRVKIINELGILAVLVTPKVLADSCRPEDEGDAFFRKVRSYKSHMASHPRRRHFSL
jgi:hypothetical protein